MAATETVEPLHLYRDDAMAPSKTWLEREINFGRVTRREFVEYCTFVAGMFALPASAGPKLAHAAEHAAKPVVVWLNFQDCTGNTESLLRGSRPTAAEVILDHLSLEYHETIMAAAGHQAEEHLDRVVDTMKGQYLALVEGSIPAAEGGIYCCIGGKSAMNIADRVCRNAAAVIAVGTCACFGGLPAAAPNPTGALSVSDAVPGLPALINMPACPTNVENLTALILYYLTFQRLPPVEGRGGRPRGSRVAGRGLPGDGSFAGALRPHRGGRREHEGQQDQRA